MEKISSIDKVVFNPVQCSFDYINTLKMTPDNIRDGTLYFVTDTQQIFLGKEKALIPMGKNTGIIYGKKTIDSTILNTDVVFYQSELENSAGLPQPNDLILNNSGGTYSFYRVTESLGNSVKALRLAVMGSGGGSFGSGFGSGLGNAQASVAINVIDFDGKLPDYIIVGQTDVNYDNFSYKIELKINDVETIGSVEQYIYIQETGEKKKVSSARSYQSTNLTVKNNWFTNGGAFTLWLICKHSGFEYYYPLGTINVLDLNIKQSTFTGAISRFNTNRFTFQGEVSVTPEAVQKIYFKLSDKNGVINPENSGIYPSGYNAENGLTIQTQTENNIVQFYSAFSNLSYGIYTLEVYQKIEYFDEIFNGPVYEYKFIAEPENTDKSEQPLLLCDFSSISGKTFTTSDTISIPIILCDPERQETESIGIVNAGFKINEKDLSNPNQNVYYGKRSIILVNRFKSAGQCDIYIEYKYKRIEDNEEVSKTIEEICSIMIEESSTTVAMPLVNLTSIGRSNLEQKATRETWSCDIGSNETITTDFENFTWADVTGEYYTGTGWCKDKNSQSVLRVSGDAKARINYKPFNLTIGDVEKPGFSMIIDFNTKNFSKRFTSQDTVDNLIIKCFDDNEQFGLKIFGDYIYFSTKKIKLKMSYMENERLHLTIVFTKLEEHEDGVKGLVKFYLNGVLSAAKIYTAADLLDNMTNLNTEFTIGCKKAVVDLYSISTFEFPLSSEQIVSSYLDSVAGTADSSKLRQENNVYINKKVSVAQIQANTNLPIMILRGQNGQKELPTEKKDKSKKVDIEFIHPKGEPLSFKAENVTIEVQGTSSQYYPVKNYKLKNLFITKEDGTAEKYKLAEDQIASSTFCLKADYAESTGTHNTQNANLIEKFYQIPADNSKQFNVKKNPAQAKEILGRLSKKNEEDNKEGLDQTQSDKLISENASYCRTTIYGYPIVLFHAYQEGDSEKIDFLGKYNFNFDKGSKEVFGFDGDCAECWEFKDNDDVSKMIVGGCESVGFEWDKWTVQYTSTKNADKTISVVLPKEEYYLKDDNGNVVDEKGNIINLNDWKSLKVTNIDEVRRQVDYHIEQMKKTTTGADKEWWESARGDKDNIVPMWTIYFEPRYCDRVVKDKNNQVVRYINSEGGLEDVCDISNFAELYNWIISTGIAPGDSPEIIQAKEKEFNDHIYDWFDKEYLLIYYIYTHFALMVDQRAKNMFFTYWKEENINGTTYGGKWQPWFYDNDTCYGINNAGFETFNYYDEDDNNDSVQVFQGENSILWSNLKTQKKSDLKQIYSILRTSGLSLDKIKEYFIDNAAKQWPIAIYNEDQENKYIKYAYSGVLVDGKNEEVIDKMRGDGITQLNRFLPDRFRYCDGKWEYYPSDNMNDSRYGTKANEAKPITINFIPFSTGYYSMFRGASQEQDIFVGENQTRSIIQAGQEYSKTFNGFGDKNVTYITNPNEITDFGDLSYLKPTQFEGSKIAKAESLKLGNFSKPVGVADSQTGLTVELNEEEIAINLSNGYSLELVDVSNITNTKGSIDLSNSPNLRKVYAKNSKSPSIILSDGGGYLDTLLISDQIKELTLKNQIVLTYNNSYEVEPNQIGGLKIINMDLNNTKNPNRNLTNITIENCPNFNSRTFLTDCLQEMADADASGIIPLKTIRVTGIDYQINDDWKFSNVEEFLEFASLFNDSENKMFQGRSDTGTYTEHPYLKGTCYIGGKVTGEQIDELKQHISGDLDIVAENASYTIRFFVKNPVTGEVSPVRAKNGEPYIESVARNGIVSNPRGNIKTIETYTSVENGKIYTHNEKWVRVPAGTNPESINVINSYTSSAFQTGVTQNLDYYASFNSDTMTYRVVFKNGNTIITTQNIRHGEDYNHSSLISAINQIYPNGIVYSGDNQADYVFNNKWKPNPVNVTQDMVCQAQFSYQAYQTYRLLERELEVFEIDKDKFNQYGIPLIKNIPSYTFYGCKKLHSIILNTDSQITLDDPSAFEDSSILTDDDNETPENSEDIKTGLIYVPKLLIDNYKNDTNGWGNFSKRIREIE